jgi:hypothetical protein
MLTHRSDVCAFIFSPVAIEARLADTPILYVALASRAALG